MGFHDPVGGSGSLGAYMSGYYGVDLFTGNQARLSILRSEERRVGKECRSRWSPYH